MLHRSLTLLGFLFVGLCCCGWTTPVRAQELLPGEREALQLRSKGDPQAAASAFLRVAETASRTAGDASHHARIEAWVTQAAQLAQTVADRDALARLDALAESPAAAADPLLRDRIRVAALEFAESLPDTRVAERSAALGFLRGGRLCGPFANERGSAFQTELPPEQRFDLTAELPGKRRAVRWRTLPAREISPSLPLARIVHPLEQSAVFLAFAVAAERDTAAVVELGSTGSWALFCNGRRVGGREVERPFAYDQDAVAVTLRAGRNLLLLKLGHLEGDDFVAAARLRGANGAPLPVVQLTADADFVAAEPGDPAAAPPALGGRSTWPIGETRGADALRLAWLWRARAADGDRDRRDAKAAEAAAAALPDLAEAWLVLAQSRVRHARSAADRDENERRQALERALAKDRDHVEAQIQLGYLLHESSNLWRQSRQLAEAALAIRPTALGAIYLHSATLRDEGLAELADAELLRAAATSTRAELWRTAANLLAEREPRTALAFRERVLTLSTAENDQVAAIQQALRCQAPSALLDRAPWAIDPYAGRLHRQRANLLLARGDARQAIDVLAHWLALAPDDADAMVLQARAWRLLRGSDADATERQLASLREALAVEPNRRDDERYADFVASEAAGGSADANAFWTPFQVDAAALVKADGGPPADAEAAHDPLHWLLRQEVVRANSNGTTNVYHHQIARVLTNDGARSLQSYGLPAYNGEQRARLTACTIFRADGTVQHPTTQGARVRLPDLRIGDVVAVEGRVDDLAPTYFGDYFGYVHVFGSGEGSPVRRDDVVVLAEKGRDYRWQVAQGAPEPERQTLADGTLQLRCTMRDLARDRPEVRRPDRKERDPVLRITTYRDWDTFAAWWWNLIKNQLEVSPAMKQTVAELCKDRPTTEARIAALYHFVTTDVRYEAWEFGVHGYKPYSTAVIHERRHGDCKDKALLLCALLGEIGVPANPVLIFGDTPRSHDDLSLAMVQHFNHCIAWLPPHDGRPGRFLDATATWHPTDTLPEMDQGAAVLIVDRGKAELRDVPYTTPAQNLEQRTLAVELAVDGSAKLRVEDRPLGNTAVELRSMLATEPARLREVVERQLVERFGKVALGEVTPSPTTDPEAAVHLTVTATLPEIGQRGQASWQLPSAWDDRNLLALTADKERVQPLLLDVPSGVHHTVRYRLPPGYRAGDLPADVDLQAPFGSFAMRWRRDGDQVTVERQLALTSPRIEVTQHAAFRDFIAAVKAADGQLVLLQKEGAR